MAVTEATAKAVRDRDRVCRYCFGREYEPGRGPQWRYVIHHRAAKGMGGTDDAGQDAPSNLVLLHDHCHTEVHARPRKARLLGLLESRLGTIRPSTLIQREPA
jgi:hypothetical protein